MELAVPVIPADDISIARQFYVDKLGFQVTFETGDGKTGMIGVKRVHDPSDNTIFVIGPLNDRK